MGREKGEIKRRGTRKDNVGVVNKQNKICRAQVMLSSHEREGGFRDVFTEKVWYQYRHCPGSLALI